MKFNRLLSMVTMIGFLVSSALVLTPAQASAATTTGSYYITYTNYKVVAGDTLWLIAKKFSTTVDTLVKINNLTSTDLQVGQVLKIPQSTPTTHYYVQPNDTLYLIGQRFGISVDKLMELNSLKDNSTIYPGQSLVIPGSYLKYTVNSGDTLFLIAQKFGTTIERIMGLNWLKSSILSVGQILLLPCAPPGIDPINSPPAIPEAPKPTPPPTVTWGNLPPGVVLYHVVAGDNLWTIANKYGTTEETIIKTNNLHAQLIGPGQPLFIPVNSTQPITIIPPSVPRKPGYGELLDWEFANWIFNTGSTAVLQDLETGKQFKIYRIGGSNHADCEPLTAEDTAVMKSVFGGTWTWNTRAVLLLIGNRVIAASMAGMPHSFDTISGNNFVGMFDLHFLNSRTHNTNEVSAAHQAMVQKAAGN